MKTLINLTAATLFFITSADAQSKVEFGAGLSYELHYLDHTEYTTYTYYSTPLVYALGLNTYLHFNSDKRFQFRLLTHLGQKDMAFSLRSNQSGGIVIESIHHKFLSADISLLGLCSFPQKNGSILQPMIGFYTSFNRFYNAHWRQSVSGNGINSGGGNATIWVPSISNEPSFIYVGVNAGLNYRTQIKDFPIELTSLFYISPASMFDFTFEYLDGLESADYKGRYHHLTLGMNIPITR